LTTLLAVLLGWYIHDIQRQREAKLEIEFVKREWMKDRRELAHGYSESMEAHLTKSFAVEKETKSLKEQLEDFRHLRTDNRQLALEQQRLKQAWA
jgi:hypothetical protein